MEHRDLVAEARSEPSHGLRRERDLGDEDARAAAGIEDRLTGKHETAPWNKFSYGVSDRGSSIRIPWQVAVDKKGYAEDRRPNANADPYTVARLITETVGAAAAGKPGPKK